MPQDNNSAKLFLPYKSCALLACSSPPCGSRLNSAGAPIKLAPPPAPPAESNRTITQFIISFS